MTNSIARVQSQPQAARDVLGAARGVVGVLTLLSLELGGRTVPREVCVTCGCLCRPDEVCPGCRVSRVEIARRVTLAEAYDEAIDSLLAEQ
jgi:hypothetical protein